MTAQYRFFGLAVILLPALAVVAETRIENVRNDKVTVVQRSLAPGETASLPADRSTLLVYLDAGSIESPGEGGKTQTLSVKRGEVVFRPPQSSSLKNTGAADLRMVTIEYVGKGSSQSWGTAGLAPSYKLLLENQWGRVYEVKIPAGATEPLHTHHDRVVVCLSGAQLEHLMPDGRKEVSSLKTDEIAWRLGATHIGQNLGKTDLWVIVIEPK